MDDSEKNKKIINLNKELEVLKSDAKKFLIETKYPTVIKADIDKRNEITPALKNKFNADKADNFNEAIKKISSSEKKLINCIGSLYNVGNILNKN